MKTRKGRSDAAWYLALTALASIATIVALLFQLGVIHSTSNKLGIIPTVIATSMPTFTPTLRTFTNTPIPKLQPTSTISPSSGTIYLEGFNINSPCTTASNSNAPITGTLNIESQGGTAPIKWFIFTNEIGWSISPSAGLLNPGGSAVISISTSFHYISGQMTTLYISYSGHENQELISFTC
jgi:hypothetical protein